MPIYEYRCPNGHTFEVFQRMADPAVESCQVCGSGPVEKVLFPVAVHFKGSGFYSTDYGRRGRKAGVKEGDAGAETSEKSEKSERSGSSEKKESPSSSGSGEAVTKKSD